MQTDERRAYQRAYNHARRHSLLDDARQMLGGACNGCGQEENLEFHHPLNVEKKFKISNGYNYPYKVFLEEVRKCELLCTSCHIEETKEENSSICRH